MTEYTKLALDEEAETGDDQFLRELGVKIRGFRLFGWEFTNARFLILQLVLLVLYTVIFHAFSERFAPRYHGANLFYCEKYLVVLPRRNLGWLHDIAPAREAVKYEITHFNATLWIDSPYVQPPSPETDKAWHDLVDSKLPCQNLLESFKVDLKQIPISFCQPQRWRRPTSPRYQSQINLECTFQNWACSMNYIAWYDIW